MCIEKIKNYFIFFAEPDLNELKAVIELANRVVALVLEESIDLIVFNGCAFEWAKFSNLDSVSSCDLKLNPVILTDISLNSF